MMTAMLDDGSDVKIVCALSCRVPNSKRLQQRRYHGPPCARRYGRPASREANERQEVHSYEEAQRDR